jgi:hypothetical protein
MFEKFKVMKFIRQFFFGDKRASCQKHQTQIEKRQSI